MTEPHNEFRYVPEPTPHTPTRGLGAGSQKSANDLAYRCASFAARIFANEPDPAKWKALIEAAPPEMHELVREYCRQRFMALKDKARRVVARDSTTAAEEMAKMKLLIGGGS